MEPARFTVVIGVLIWSVEAGREDLGKKCQCPDATRMSEDAHPCANYCSGEKAYNAQSMDYCTDANDAALRILDPVLIISSPLYVIFHLKSYKNLISLRFLAREKGFLLRLLKNNKLLNQSY